MPNEAGKMGRKTRYALLLERQKVEIEALEKRIEKYEKLEQKMQKILDNAATYSMLAKILRWATVFTLIVAAVLFFLGLGMMPLFAMVVALIILAGSIGADYTVINAENTVHECGREIRKARLAVLKLKNRH